jgi:ABC-2 type transport system permease protein
MGLTEKQALALVSPVATDVSVLYNPNFSYTTFICPGVIFAQFQVIIMMTALLLVNLEFRTRHRRDYPAPYATALKPWAILLSAVIPYLIILTAVAAAVLTILFPLFNIHLHGSFAGLFFTTALFVVASFMPGLLPGLLMRKAVSGIAFAIVFNMPAFIFSGFMFPLWAMPQPLALIANILPFKHYAAVFFKIGMAGAPLSYCVHEILILVLFIVLPAIPGVWLFAAKRRYFFDISHKPLHVKVQS